MRGLLFIGLTLLAVAADAESGGSRDCPEAKTTASMVDCLVALGHDADAELDRYVSATANYLSSMGVEQGRVAEEDLKRSQDTWRSYRERYCQAVASQFGPGTMAGPAMAGCYLRATRQRTHALWDDFLRDSPLPEPRHR